VPELYDHLHRLVVHHRLRALQPSFIVHVGRVEGHGLGVRVEQQEHMEGLLGVGHSEVRTNLHESSQLTRGGCLAE